MIEAEQSNKTNLTTEFVYGDEKWALYKDLYEGLRNNRDPVTVRTFLLDVERILGVENPEWEKVPEEKWEEATMLVDILTEGTLWGTLKPEYLDALGVKTNKEESLKPLKLVVANGRHHAEPLWSGIAKYVAEKYPGKVGKFNPVGHYNDGQPRVTGPRRLLRKLDTFMVLGSTQTEKGGSLEVMSHVARLIRNFDFSLKIDNLVVTIPFFGGSRGHREGQGEWLVYEIKEGVSNPKILGLPLIEARLKLWWGVVKNEFMSVNPLGLLKALGGMDLPKLKIATVDIHNDELPAKKFEQMGIEFINADPTPETARATLDILEKNGLMDKKLLIEASDKGAIPRTERYAIEILKQSGKNEIYVGNMDKTRLVAGKVEEVKIGKIEKWTIKDGEITREELSKKEISDLFEEEIVLAKSDDMVDTGGTNKKDEAFLRSKIKNVCFSVTIATHPVFSKGADILDDIGSDAYIFTNTLIHNGLSKREDVTIVDASPSIARALNF